MHNNRNLLPMDNSRVLMDNSRSLMDNNPLTPSKHHPHNLPIANHNRHPGRPDPQHRRNRLPHHRHHSELHLLLLCRHLEVCNRRLALHSTLPTRAMPLAHPPTLREPQDPCMHPSLYPAQLLPQVPLEVLGVRAMKYSKEIEIPTTHHLHLERWRSAPLYSSLIK